MAPSRPLITLRLPFGVRTRRAVVQEPTTESSVAAVAGDRPPTSDRRGPRSPRDAHRAGRRAPTAWRRSRRSPPHRRRLPPSRTNPVARSSTTRPPRSSGWPSPRRSRRGRPPSRTRRWPPSKAGSIRRRGGAPPATPTSSPRRSGWSGARDAARQAWEAAGLLDAGTLLGTANALRLSQIVESLHGALRALPPPEALSSGRPGPRAAPGRGRRRRRARARAADRGRGARLARQGRAPSRGADRRRAGGDRARARQRSATPTPWPARRLLAAHPDGRGRRAGRPDRRSSNAPSAHGVPAARTLCKPIAPATLVDEAIDLLRRRRRPSPTVLVGIAEPALRATVHAAAGRPRHARRRARRPPKRCGPPITQSRPELCVLDDRARRRRGPAHRRGRCAANGRSRHTGVVLVTADGDDADAARGGRRRRRRRLRAARGRRRRCSRAVARNRLERAARSGWPPISIRRRGWRSCARSCRSSSAWSASRAATTTPLAVVVAEVDGSCGRSPPATTTRPPSGCGAARPAARPGLPQRGRRRARLRPDASWWPPSA